MRKVLYVVAIVGIVMVIIGIWLYFSENIKLNKVKEERISQSEFFDNDQKCRKLGQEQKDFIYGHFDPESNDCIFEDYKDEALRNITLKTLERTKQECIQGNYSNDDYRKYCFTKSGEFLGDIDNFEELVN